MTPRVTFIVPCYKLAHLLPDCINSIRRQTYADFEILIMDDCSPDNTAEVARAFNKIDPRVKHIRNEPNLGHLRNYNKGIELAQGEYIWLISADDQLRRPYALERYLEVMERRPEIGFACCPAWEMDAVKETKIAQYSVLSDRDTVFSSVDFFRKLITHNPVIAAAGMVRRAAYEKCGAFPLDLPYAGDWYLWAVFARHFEVAYFADPMVNYRQHAQSMTNILTRKDHARDNVKLCWTILRLAQELGSRQLVQEALQSLVSYHAHYLFAVGFRGAFDSTYVAQIEALIEEHGLGASDANAVRAGIYCGVADDCYAFGEPAEALPLYRLALRFNIWKPTIWTKIFLLRTGKLGRLLRDSGKRMRADYGSAR